MPEPFGSLFKMVPFSSLEILWVLGNIRFALISCYCLTTNLPVIFQLTGSASTKANLMCRPTFCGGAKCYAMVLGGAPYFNSLPTAASPTL